MILKKYIKEVLMINERNQPGLLKKSFDYDLLIADLTPHVMAGLYSDFLDEDMQEHFVDIKVGDPDYSNASFKQMSDEHKIMALESDIDVSLIILKKSWDNVELLKDKPYNFNFANCNVSDSKPILCLPSQGGSFESQYSVSDILKQIKGQKFNDLENWNWLAHDFHHAEEMIRTDADQRIAAGAIGQGAGKWGSESIDLPTGYEYLDTDVIGSIGPRHQMPLEPMPLLIIGLYFNKIKFTQHVDGEDIWTSIYAYCLTKMKRAKDAYQMDFTIVNEEGKIVLVNDDDRRNFQDFFAVAYKNVHKYSLLSRYSSSDSKIDPHKLKDDCIYIYYFRV